jgi:hypothetical protein
MQLWQVVPASHDGANIVPKVNVIDKNVGQLMYK